MPSPQPDTAPPASEGPVSEQPATEEPVRRLSARSLAWRALAILAGTLLIVNGSVRGSDRDWPFASMGQFAFRTGTDDVIRSTFLAAVDQDGMLQRVALSPNNIGIARAEIEGQQRNFVFQPSMLKNLAENYHQRHPGAPQLTQLWLAQDVTKLHKGRDVGTSQETIVGWPANTLTPPSLPGPGGAKVAVDLHAPENSVPNNGEDRGQSGQEGRK